MTTRRIRNAAHTRPAAPTLIWGTLALITVAFGGIFLYGLVTDDDPNPETAAPVPRCVMAEIAFQGRVQSVHGEHLEDAVVRLRRVGALENCDAPDDDDPPLDPAAQPQLPVVVQTLHTDAEGHYMGAVQTRHNSLFRLEVTAPGYEEYQSPQFSASYLPYWQFKVIELEPKIAVLG
jgi:hypothetical protein